MDSPAFWEENSSSVRIPVKFESCNSSDVSVASQPCKEEQSLFQYCDGNLNFATAVATSEDDEFSYHKKKISRDPMSHRIIEKRRRDRMNNCLADLSRLIPADYLKKGRGRIEKTEIIEMAIKHMKHLQSRATKPTDCAESDLPSREEPMENSSAPSSGYQSSGGGPIITEHYRLGYQECLSEAMHFMVEVEGFYAGDPLCVQLINHLQKHCDKILKGDRLNFPRAHVNETTSNSSGSSGSYPHHSNNVHSASGSPNSGGSSSDFRNESLKDDRSNPAPLRNQMEETYEDNVVDLTSPSQLRDMLTSPNLVSHNQTVPKRNFTPMSTGSMSNSREMNSSAASLYKFKNNIKQRFSAEHHEENGTSKRRRFEMPNEAMRRNSDTCSVPSSPPSPDLPHSPSPKVNNIPIFALHAKGSYYVPLTLDADVLAPYFNDLNLVDDTSQSCDITTLVLHPVTISVNFKQSNHHRIDTRPHIGLSMTNSLWKNESSGFGPLPNWYQNERLAMSIPPYNKNV